MTIDDFLKGNDGTMVPVTCENHPDLRWSCKKVALSIGIDGKYRYNGRRSLFYSSWEKEECTCSFNKLYALIDYPELA